MNKQAKKWVAALRSGKFSQGKFTLRNLEDEYCCLGVAGELYRYRFGFKWKKERAYYTLRGEHLTLPHHAMVWLGLASSNGEFVQDGVTKTLSMLNDEGASFDEIADLIESEPEGLFVGDDDGAQ